jgi:hypothetical protein
MALKFPTRSNAGLDGAAQRLRRSLTRAKKDTPMQPTPDAIVIDMRDSGRNGQQIAGSGALVFEGEFLERKPSKFH